MRWPEEEIQDIQELMRERFGGLIHPGASIAFTGETESIETKAALRLGDPSDGSRLDIEVILDRQRCGADEEDGKCLVLDAIDCLAFDWLESDRSERFHGGWQKRSFQNVELNVRMERSFPELEARAEEILKRDGSGES